mmetsp:Transcript_8029/g.17931  ORF Transcript_8029/g.17931 Transcript_8029/m.17931 type:complete len:681 (+) Transcript_8029:77-2119(+)
MCCNRMTTNLSAASARYPLARPYVRARCTLLTLGLALFPYAAAAEDTPVQWLRHRARRVQANAACPIEYTGSWTLLSSERQEAWGTLGWSEGLWNVVHWCGLDEIGSPTCEANPTRPPSDSQCYGNLTEEERIALRVLGYSIQDWHGCKNPTCPWPDGIPLPSASCLEHLDYLEHRYSPASRSWDSIPLAERIQMERLMWDLDRWNTYSKPNSYAIMWSQLTAQERASAGFLGYNQELWDGCPGTPCFERLFRLQEQLRPVMWVAMLPGIRNLLQALGWTEAQWARGEQPDAWELAWVDLPTLRQQARLLGYTEDSWDGCPDSPCVHRFQHVSQTWDDRSWSSMKLAEQQAWLLLGQTESLWEILGMQQTPTFLSQFYELTPEQQEAALFIQHSPASWRGCSNTSMVQVMDEDQDGGGTQTAGDGDTSVQVDYLVGGSYQTLCVRAVSEAVEDASGCAMSTRTVRGRMTIERPFSEISGNIYGQQVADLPTSFVQVFETAVSRALFCDNPPLSINPNDMVGPNGEPRCDDEDEYNRQRHRIRVVRILEGSIIVDFFIIQNLTATDNTAVYLFEALQRQLAASTSPIALDIHFGSFAAEASMVEIAISQTSASELENVLEFEDLRNQYNEDNMCELTSNWVEDFSCRVGAASHLATPHIWLLMFLHVLLLHQLPGRQIGHR